MNTSGETVTKRSFDELRRRATAYDRQAQFELARLLEAAGDGAQAAHWLHVAAEAGNIQATALLGVWQLLARNVKRNEQAGIRRLQQAAHSGDAAACSFLATLHAAGFAADCDWQLAADWLIAAAKLGNERALTQLALLVEHSQTELRARLFYAAAERGSAIAPYFLGKMSLASPDRGAQRAGELWMAVAATAGNPRALQLAQPLAGMHALPAGPPLAASFWKRVAAAFDPQRFLVPVQIAVSTSEPYLARSQALLAPSLCDYLIGLAAPLLVRAEVNDVEQGRKVHEMRTNWQARFPLTNTDVIGIIAARRVALLAQEPFENQEDAMVLRYRPGEAYEEHYDFIDPRVIAFERELATQGQRIATVLVYLNDEYDGGYTEFPQLRWRFRGTQGDALVFRNVTAAGVPDRRMLHAGRPPLTGEKWLLSKWVRDRPQLGRQFR